MNYLTHSQNLIISVDEVDFLERLKPSAIMQYFQDIATIHALEIGVGYEDLKEKNLLWVLSRMSVRIDKYPTLGETIKVITYPRKPVLANAIRDYYVEDTMGNVIIRGTSRWCVIDGTSHIPKRCEQLFKHEQSRYINTDAMDKGNISIPKLQNYKSVFDNSVKITDLDRNIHMNNARYGDVMYNALDLSKLKINAVKSFDINFLSELKHADEYTVIREEIEDYTLVGGIRKTDGKTVFRAKVDWLK